MGQNNKELNRKLVEEILNQGNFAVADDLLARDLVDHAAPPGAPGGPDSVKGFFRMWREAFPDLHFTLHEIVGDGDLTVVRNTWTGTHRGAFMGIPPTGKEVSVSGFDMTRWRDGKAVEHWAQMDVAGLMAQLGVGLR